MKTKIKHKMFLAFMTAGTLSIFQAEGQTNVTTPAAPNNITSGYIPVANGNSSIKNTVTPIYEDQNNSRIGIGTFVPSYRLDVNGNIGCVGYSIISTGHNNNNGGITNTGAISGATTISASGSLTSTGHNNSNGGITNAGAISGATTISASGAISGTTITGSGAISGTTITGSNLISGTAITATNGDFNTTSAYKGYQIGGNYMLWNNNKSGCIYVGTAGSSGNTGTNNTFLGYQSGNANTSGGNNTFIGYRSGYSNLTATNNIFMGYEACSLSTYASDNVAIGYQAMAKQAFGTTAWSSYNVAIGREALYNLNSSATTDGLYNIAMGYKTGVATTTGHRNTFLGTFAAESNTTGAANTFVGYQAGDKNTTASDNTGLGYNSCYYNQTGTGNVCVGHQAGFGVSGNSFSYNSFLGYQAAKGITTGSSNVFLGYKAGFTTTTGSNNIYIGRSAGYYNLSGTQNVAIGNYAGDNPTSTSNNTYIGYNADDGVDCSNCAAIGANAVASGSDKMYFGDANVSECRTINCVSTSDGRFKINVNEDVKGLEFINKLRPVTYNIDTKSMDVFLRQNMKVDSADIDRVATTDYSKSSGIVHSGFIAQEVEQAATESGFQSSIVSIPTQTTETYGLAYGEFVVPLVKGMQELSNIVDSLKTVIATLQGAGQKTGNTTNTQGNAETTLNVDLANNTETILYQNEPNPFDGSTVIRYFIPENVANAYVGFYDMYGKEIKKLEIKERGFGKIEANTENLASGIYSYSIIVNDKTVETKKMLKSK